MKTRIYTIIIDCDFDKRLKMFTQKLGENEEITSQVVADNKLLIFTKEDVGSTYGRPKNLLLEEMKK